MQRVRADAYHAARLLDAGLTAWTSHWAEGHELRQRAAFYTAARRQRLLEAAFRGWFEEAGRQRIKRQHMEM